MQRIQGQITAGVSHIPVVDVNFTPIIIGCLLRATVAISARRLTFREVEVRVDLSYLPECVLRGDGWCIPFYYDHTRGVMVGANVSSTFPVWCEVISGHQPILR
jgi:hypothetical protein